MTNIMAAAIGFYALICLAPMALLLAWALQPLLGRRREAYEWVATTVERLAGEAATGIMGEIDALLTNPDAHVAGIVSIAVLLWAGLRLFEALEMSLTDIWPGPRERGVIARKALALASMIAAGLLIITAIVLTALVPAVLEGLTSAGVMHIDETTFVQRALRVVIELAAVFAAFFLLFRFIPAEKVSSRVAAVGAIFTAVLWRAVTPIFAMVVARSGEQSAIYGGFAGVVMFLTWAFFSAHILLLGAHFASAYQHVVSSRRAEDSDESFIRGVHEPTDLEEE